MLRNARRQNLVGVLSHLSVRGDYWWHSSQVPEMWSQPANGRAGELLRPGIGELLTGEDEHLESEYEDRNGDPHGVGSPEYDEEGSEGGWDDDLPYDEEDKHLEPYGGEHGYPDDENDVYLGTYVSEGVEDDPLGRQPGDL